MKETTRGRLRLDTRGVVSWTVVKRDYVATVSMESRMALDNASEGAVGIEKMLFQTGWCIKTVAIAHGGGDDIISSFDKRYNHPT
jgi:hypothetical protein